MKAPIYWCVYRYGEALVKCSEHRSVEAAERSARKCERRGGTRHTIYRLIPIPRAKKPT